MKTSTIILTLVAIAVALSPAWAAKNKSMEDTIKESQKAADDMVADLARQKEAEKKAMEDYWDAQPDAPAALPGNFLSALKKLPWPDIRPVPKEKYFPRPEVKVEAPVSEEEDDPLMAGYGKKEKAARKDLESAQKESDSARFSFWLQNIDFYTKALGGCEAGAIEGAERVKTMESALIFIKEGQPEFYLRTVADKGVKLLKVMEDGIKTLIANLEKEGQYIPDYRAVDMAEKISGRLAAAALGAGEPLGEKEKQRYYKVVDRLIRLDPRAPQVQTRDAGVKYAAGGGEKDAKWEDFLTGLIARNNKALSGINFAAQPSEYPAILAKIEKEINAMLASFPAGWQKYPRAKWAHDWLSGALEKSRKASDPSARGRELFRALNDFEAGLR